MLEDLNTQKNTTEL